MTIEEETLEKTLIYCMTYGDQKLLDILYPYFKSKYKTMPKSVVKHFSMIINSKDFVDETEQA